MNAHHHQHSPEGHNVPKRCMYDLFTHLVKLPYMDPMICIPVEGKKKNSDALKNGWVWANVGFKNVRNKYLLSPPTYNLAK